MSIYAIGDIQGCARELWALLDHLAFNPQHDRLWFVGDLINRGPDSLEVLRFVYALGDAAVVVLGNHDLHLLAIAAGNLKHAHNSTLDAVLAAPEREELLHWLRCRPLLYHDAERALTLIHAGLPPQWTLTDARAAAAEVETVLRGADYQRLLLALYGNQPEQWTPELHGLERLRFIINCLTRLRFCTTDGRLALKEKGDIGTQTTGLVPWFQVANRRTRADRIIFGHWSTLGYYAGEQVWAIDSGCLWGGQLTALRVEPPPLTPLHWDCAGYLVPGEE
jgi:bis(5'-nucleosyl)-tetraphosphatase (symmetrical)